MMGPLPIPMNVDFLLVIWPTVRSFGGTNFEYNFSFL